MSRLPHLGHRRRHEAALSHDHRPEVGGRDSRRGGQDRLPEVPSVGQEDQMEPRARNPRTLRTPVEVKDTPVRRLSQQELAQADSAGECLPG